MSDTLLEIAMDRFYARKDATEGSDLPQRERADLALSGLDLDLDEAAERMHHLAHSVMLTAGLSGQPVCTVMADALVNAMAMGVLHERERAERDRVHADA